MKRKVLVFFPYPLEKRRGGPSTYLYNLKESIKSLNENSIAVDFLSEICSLQDLNFEELPRRKIVANWLSKLLPSKFSNSIRVYRYIRRLKNKSTSFKKTIANLNFSQYDIIHFHSPVDVWLYQDFLKNFKGQILLTSHSPVPFHIELLQEVYNIDASLIYSWTQKSIMSIDNTAFNIAKGIVAPTKNSMDGYKSYWKEYATIEEDKECHYVLTGAPQLPVSYSVQPLRPSLNIPPDAFVICFNGRHSISKGFDLFVGAAEILLNKYENIYFIITGCRNAFLGKSFDTKRWVDVGWTNRPGDFITASDMVVIPNRETFFDLNTIETLSLGKFVLISGTGGNKFFRSVAHRKGIQFFDTLSIEALSEALSLCYENRNSLRTYGLANKELYQQYFRPDLFAKAYLTLYNSLR